MTQDQLDEYEEMSDRELEEVHQSPGIYTQEEIDAAVRILSRRASY